MTDSTHQCFVNWPGQELQLSSVCHDGTQTAMLCSVKTSPEPGPPAADDPGIEQSEAALTSVRADEMNPDNQFSLGSFVIL